MHPPILVSDKETKDISIFDSLREAELFIEPYDVAAYEIYDADGRVINAALEKPAGKTAAGPGTVRLVASGERRIDRLCAALRNYLRILKRTIPHSDATLDSLLELLTGNG